MRRFVFVCALLVVSAVAAQAQTVATSAGVVTAGGSTNVVISGGTAGGQFAVIASATNGGFSYAGVNLSVGTDVQIVTVGALDGSGAATVPVTPPFPTYDRFYYQVVFTPNGFASITASPSLVVMNAQEARIYLSVGGGTSGAGAGFALSPGVAVTRTGPGAYAVTFANQFVGAVNVIPTITPFCGQSPTSMSANNGGFTVAFASDCGFFFTATPIRR